jgi:YHS domain-containing protein
MAQVKDPVCNTTIDALTAAGQTSYLGQSYYFCSERCASQFQASPGRYAIPTRPPGSTLRDQGDRRPDAV